MPLTSPREAAPGPGLWNVTDLDDRLRVTQGQLLINGASAEWDRTMMVLQTPYARHKGRYLEFEFTPDSADKDMDVAWQTDLSGSVDVHEAGIRFAATGQVVVLDGPGLPINPRYDYAGGTSYVGRIYDGGPPTTKAGGSNDWYMYVRPSDEENWSLLWRKPASPSWLTQVYAALNNLDHTGSMNYVRIRESTLLLVHHYSARPVANSFACADADALCEVLVQCPATGTPGMNFRYTDALNYWKLEMDLAASRLDLTKVVAGTPSLVDSVVVSWRTDRLYLLRAVLIGDRITTFVGRQRGPVADDSFSNDAELFGPLGDADYYDLRADVGGELLW